eukprot:m.187907 g.187907  ORF g.187907 m.187907 type:complete len:138 (-) comp10021_c1_seq14:68-481(-)
MASAPTPSATTGTSTKTSATGPPGTNRCRSCKEWLTSARFSKSQLTGFKRGTVPKMICVACNTSRLAREKEEAAERRLYYDDDDYAYSRYSGSAYDDGFVGDPSDLANAPDRGHPMYNAFLMTPERFANGEYIGSGD